MKSCFKRIVIVLAIFGLTMSSILPTLHPLAATASQAHPITITNLTNASQTVTGTGEENSDVLLVSKTGDTLGYGKTDATGQFSILVSRKLVFDEPVKIYVTNAAGHTELLETNVLDDLAPETPNILGSINHLSGFLSLQSSYYSEGNLITATVGDVVYTTIVGSTGHMEPIKLTTQPKIGEKVVVTETSKRNGKVSKPKIAYVTDGIKEYPALTFDTYEKPLTSKSLQVTVHAVIGTYYSGLYNIALVLGNGIILKKTAAFDYDYGYISTTFSIPPQPVGAKLTTYVISDGGYPSQETSIYVGEPIPDTSGSITLDPYVAQDKQITGKWTGDVANVALQSSQYYYGEWHQNAAGTKIPVQVDGLFSLPLDSSNTNLANENINYYIISYDKYGRVLNKVWIDPYSGYRLEADSYFIGKDSVTGKISGSQAIQYTSIDVNGVSFPLEQVKKDRTFAIPAAGIIKSASDTVYIHTYNSSKKELTTHKLTIPQETLTADNYTVNDAYITGNYTGDATAVNITINGQLYKNGSLSKGTFKFYVNDKKIKKNDAVLVQLYNGNTQVAQTKLTIAEAFQATTAPFNIGTDKYISATYQNADVASVSLVVDGTTYHGGTIKDGIVTFYALDKISSADQHVSLLFYDNQNKLLAEQKVAIEKKSFTASANTFKLDDKNIIANYQNGAFTKVSLVVDGVTYNGGTIAKDTVTFYALDKIKSSNEKVTMYFYNPQNKLLGQTNVAFEKRPFSVILTPFKLGDKNILVSYKNRNVAKVSLTVDGVVYNGGTIADGTISYYALDKIKADSKDVSMQFYDVNNQLLLQQALVITK
ncbi:immunoglobulin-like domain-containing protein [Listeria booriae]|uniref:immunoglobulin-like domain-containing protein n=1 Tax=Listeria booriae TaxID=1552123 RepID=UPI001625E9D6|nr:immunoglobulin-like domain-containing protein [Listeria booriae]MBC2390910.1 hypothetical protein [Listeria booriae]